MSQVTHPRTSLPVPAARPSPRVWLGALVALVALVAAVALILALGGESSDNGARVGVQAESALRPDGGPEETTAAAAIGSRPSPIPDESRIVAAIGTSTPKASGGPDESRIAAAIAGR